LAEPAYEQRYCAFVDILGFGELIDRLNQGQTSFRSLQELLTKVHNPPPTTASTHEESDFRAQSISDAVALSAAINTAGIGAIIHSINRLAVDLLTRGFFIRGAIVKDDLYHDDKMVFGKALVRAYRLETSVAEYPRVMVAQEVVRDVRKIDDATAKRLLRQSEDGPIFLHLLRAIEMDMLPVDPGKQKWRRRFDDESFHGKLLPYIGIADQIQRRFDEATDNPNHFKKIKWFASYWNRTIQDWNVDGFRYIIGPGLETCDLGFLPK
jgi:hypothetical protein